MQDQEAQKILEDAYFKVAVQVGTPGSARSYGKRKLSSAQRTAATEGNYYQKARELLDKAGNIVADEPDCRLALYAVKGFDLRNPAVVELTFTDTEVTVTAWAKEGWISQKTAQKAADAALEKLGLKSKEGFRRNYLRPAIDMNLIRMTIPDKPNSRNQRYIKI